MKTLSVEPFFTKRIIYDLSGVTWYKNFLSSVLRTYTKSYTDLEFVYLNLFLLTIVPSSVISFRRIRDDDIG